MKNIQNSLSAAICGLVLMIATSASAQNTKQGIATIVRIQGVASYSLDNTTWTPLVVGKVLQAGATIKTAPGSMVDVVLGKTVEMPQASSVPDRISFAPDSPVRGMIDYKPSVEQNVIRMTGDTTLKIDKLTISDTGVDTVSDTELDLQHGRIFASVKKLSAASQYLIKIPNGIAGVRGTLFGLDANGWCAVIKNSVLLSQTGPDGQPVTTLVGEGNQYTPGGGQSPLPPGLLYIFRQVSTALNTMYVEIVSFSFDRTVTHVSPTTGNSSPPPPPST